MIRLQGKVDRTVHVACSGGVDSMAVVDFLSRNHVVTPMFFDHGTEASSDSLEFLLDRFERRLRIGKITREKERDESWEEYWRNQRYSWFHSFDHPVITCHHLDDCMETWIWSSLHGEGKIIPYSNQNVVRSFRLTHKTQFTDWCRNNNVPWIEDLSNEDTRHMRNYIRKMLMPSALVVNPGLAKVIAKKVDQDYKNRLTSTQSYVRLVK
jgi:tRNA(Ile)-lysidine synthase